MFSSFDCSARVDRGLLLYYIKGKAVISAVSETSFVRKETGCYLRF